MDKPMSHNHETCRKKIEVFTANYPVSVTLDSRVKKELVTGEEAVGK
jgi:hypothetical protein